MGIFEFRVVFVWAGILVALLDVVWLVGWLNWEARLGWVVVLANRIAEWGGSK